MFVRAAQEASEGFYTPTVCKSEASATLVRSFQSAYLAHWGSAPDPMAAMSYDAVMILVHMNQSSSQAVSRGFPPDFYEPGVTGELSFDSQGNRKLSLELLKGRNGSFVPNCPN